MIESATSNFALFVVLGGFWKIIQEKIARPMRLVRLDFHPEWTQGKAPASIWNQAAELPSFYDLEARGNWSQSELRADTGAIPIPSIFQIDH